MGLKSNHPPQAANGTPPVKIKNDMRIEIKSIFGKILFDEDFSCLADAVSAAARRGANLSGANLRGANLSGANLIDAINTPKIKRVPIKDAIRIAVNSSGKLLGMNDWHTCETTHCIGGWTTRLHPEGELLESIYGTSAAAALILNACGEDVPNFTASNEEAMEWINAPSKFVESIEN